MVALTIALLLQQAGEADAGTPYSPALAEAQLAIDSMRDTLRAVEHGLQEASALGDTRAYNCVKTGHLALTHQVESAEQWQVLLRDAVAQDDSALAERQLKRIAESQREVQRRAAELATCKLSVEPAAPVMNRTWFGCNDAPSTADNPAWRRCEKRRASMLAFGLEGLLVAVPAGSLVALSQRGIGLDAFGGLALESAAGGLIGGLALFTLSGALALAVTSGLTSESTGRVGAIVGLCTAVGVGSGAIIGMWLDRPQAGAGAIVAASVSYAVIAVISAVLIAVHDHFSVAPGDEPTLFEQTFGITPALMAVSGMLTVPAVWSLFANR